MLHSESESKNVTPTVLLTQITSRYLLRDKILDELQFLPLSKEFVKNWLNRITREDIINDSELARKYFREYIVYFYHKLDPDSTIRFLDLWLSTQGVMQKKVDSGTRSYTIRHNICENYSDFLEGMLFPTIDDIISTKTKRIEKTPNLLSFEFEVRC